MIFLNLFMFVVSVIGMSHIIVDGSIMQTFRDVVKGIAKNLRMEKLGTVVDCYMCAGTWCGFLMGYVWLVEPVWQLNTLFINVFEIFGCGCAGGFLSNFAAVLMNYLEAGTIINMNDEPLAQNISREDENESGS